MQRLALVHGRRRILHKSSSAIRLFSVPSDAESESLLNVSEPLFMPAKSPEELPESPDRVEMHSSGRMAPRVNNLGDISIPRVMSRTPRISIKNDPAPTKNPQSNLNYLSNSTLDFSSRLAKRQLDKTSSIRPSDKIPPEMSASLQRRLEGRKRAKERAGAEMIASRTPTNTRSRDVNPQNQMQDDQRRGVNGQRSRGARSDSDHQKDGRGVNTHQRRDVNQRPSTSNPHQRARGRTFNSHLDSLQMQNQSPKASFASTSKQPSSSRKSGGSKHIFARSSGFNEKPNISETNLHALFGEVTTHQNTHSITPYTSKCPSGETLAFLRSQIMLEEAGGDYSRYLPPRLVGMGGPVGPVRYANLTLARRKDVGLRARSNVVRIINASAGGNKAQV